jgi:hypothetical protein
MSLEPAVARFLDGFKFSARLIHSFQEENFLRMNALHFNCSAYLYLDALLEKLQVRTLFVTLFFFVINKRTQ